jgi:MFS family permease
MSTPEKRDLPGFVVLLLILATAVPAAVIVLPNTAAYAVPQAVRDLGLADGQAAGFVRACGLALPALLLATPLSAVFVRRLPAWTVLFAGLAVMLGAQAASAYATSLPLVGAVRVAEGAGAGAVLPAALVLAWERRERRAAAGMWAGALTASLVLATPLALSATPVPDPDGVAWRGILHPHWWLGATALIGAGLLGVLRLRQTRPTGIAPSRHSERIQLLLPVVPAAGFAFLAVVTTYDWSPGAQLLLAGCGIAGLLGLATVGSRDAITGSPLGYAVVMLAAGLLAMPVTGPLAGLLGGRNVSLAPFAAGAGCAALAAIASAVHGRFPAGRGAVLCGYGLAVVAILLLLTLFLTLSLTMETKADQWALLGALCALGAGTGLAVGAALRHTEIGSALFGLSLCFPAALSGHLIVGPLQVAKVGAVTKAGGGAAEALVALTAAYRLWLVAAGVMAVVLAAVTAWVSRGRTRRTTAMAAAPESDGAALQAG